LSSRHSWQFGAGCRDRVGIANENNHSTLTTEGMAVDDVASGGQIVFALGTVRDCRIEAGPTARRLQPAGPPAEIARRQRRATAFGIMNAVYGVAGFLESVLLGSLYDASILAVVLVSTLSQASALLVFICLVARET
jgi:hypothetical protein